MAVSSRAKPALDAVIEMLALLGIPTSSAVHP